MTRAPRAVTATDQGYALAALLVMVSVMAVLLSTAVPAWSTLRQREREAELVFRGEQYARAIAHYQQAFGNAPPPSLDALVTEGFLRRRYTDPMVPGGDFVPLTAGAALGAGEGGETMAALETLSQSTGGLGGIVGVTSSSSAASLRDYNGARQYNQWLFLATAFSNEAGLPAEGGPTTEAQGGAGDTPPGGPGRGRGGRGGPAGRGAP
jgi:type II secretory pathway pseudopilin PulG